MTANVAGYYLFVLRLNDIDAAGEGSGNETRIWFLKGNSNTRAVSVTVGGWADGAGTQALLTYLTSGSNPTSPDLVPVAYFYGKTNNSGASYNNISGVQAYFYMNQNDTIQLYSWNNVWKIQSFELLVNLVTAYP
jgi:hypothetical protein